MTSGIIYVLTTFVILCCNFSPGLLFWFRTHFDHGPSLVGSSLIVQWLRLGAFTVGAQVRSTPCWAAKIPQAEWLSQKKMHTWLAHRYFTLRVSWSEPLFPNEPTLSPASLNSENVWSSTQFLVKSWLIRSPGVEQPTSLWACLSPFRWMSWIYPPSPLLTLLQSILRSRSLFSLLPHLCGHLCAPGTVGTLKYVHKITLVP